MIGKRKVREIFTENEWKKERALVALLEYRQRRRFAMKYGSQTDYSHTLWENHLYEIYEGIYECNNGFISELEEEDDEISEEELREFNRIAREHDISQYEVFIKRRRNLTNPQSPPSPKKKFNFHLLCKILPHIAKLEK